jgi:beta-glucuronidase
MSIGRRDFVALGGGALLPLSTAVREAIAGTDKPAESPTIPLPPSADPQHISLNGEWKFSADYQDWGERYRWFDPSYGDGVWDQVHVPHTWSVDPRFPAYIGAGWYRMRFTAPPAGRDRFVRLAFEAVGARAKVWLNGKLLGEHEGSYTPFEFDIGPLLKYDEPNLLVVRADNRWNEHTIPGANPGPNPQDQVKAWWDDGGILRDVNLILTPPVYIVRQKIEASPDLASGSATVRARVWVRNTLDHGAPVVLTAELWRETESLKLPSAGAGATIPARSTQALDLVYTLDPAQVSLWSIDTPVLYNFRSSLAGGASDTVSFGIRRFEVSGTRLLLNGRPIRLAGANRIPSGPDWGQNDPPERATRDMQLMKEAGLVLARMSHYPLSRCVLDWADRHGMLFIEEPGSPAGLDAGPELARELRAKLRAVFRETVERDWNRPSIVAWSVGNEFASDTPAGVQLVKEMRDLARSLDPTRLVTFASNRVTTKVPPNEEGSYYVDFVCMNTYSDPLGNGAHIDIMHARYPDKPLVVSEYGMRADFVNDETEREDWFRAMIAELRKRPFLSGASVWSFNDYRSRYVGTNPNGYREWGLVDGERNPRGSYFVLRRELSGFAVTQAQITSGNVVVQLAARSDFPVYPPAPAELKIRMMDGQGRFMEIKSVPVPPMAPGTEQTFRIPVTPGASRFYGEVWRRDSKTLTFGTVGL